MLREKLAGEIQGIIERYPEKRSAVLPLLEKAQELQGHLTKELLEEIGEVLDMSAPEVYSVASFYSMFHLEPVGKNRLYVCRTLSCALAGSGDLLSACEKKLGIGEGETTEDGQFSLFSFECLGSCGTAPVIMANREYHEEMDLAKLDALLERLSKETANDVVEQSAVNERSGEGDSPDSREP